MEKKWHALELSEIEKQLNTSLEGGISVKEARVRLEEEKRRSDGERFSLFVPKKANLFVFLLSFLKTPSVLILIVLSFLSYILGASLGGLMIFLTAAAGALICGAISSSSVKRQADMLEYASPMVKVKRGGSIFFTDGRNAVEGDIILLSRGDILPCDARIISSGDLTVKELIHTKSGIRNRTVKKQGGITVSNDSDAPNACNMLYAGSAVTEGEAVAVVVSTGENVYLAKYCGDSLLRIASFSESEKTEFEYLFRKIFFASAVSLAVLSLLSIITMHGENFLSTFLMMLASISMISPEVVKTVKSNIFSSYLDGASRSERKTADTSAYIRDIRAFETLSDVTELVLLGRAAFSYGIYRVRNLCISGGEITDGVVDNEAKSRLVSYIYTYIKALDECGLKTELVLDGIRDSLFEYLKNSRFDKKGVDLILNSLFFAPNGSATSGYACAETPEGAYRLILTSDREVLSFCSSFRKADSGLADLGRAGMEQIAEFNRQNEEAGGKCIYVVSEFDGEAIFEGAISLVEERADDIENIIDGIQKMGIRIIPMLSDEAYCEHISSNEFFSKNIAYASDFKENNFDITHNFGEYTAYVGFSDDEHIKLIDLMRENGAVVAAYGVGNEYHGAMSHADMAISCDVLNYSSQKYRESVYERLPEEGRDSNIRCSQQTRFLAKMLVHRANKSGGGLRSIEKAVKRARGAQSVLSQSLLYYTAIMSVILPIAAMSPIVGIGLLNGVQTVCLSVAAVILSANVFVDCLPDERSLQMRGRRLFDYLYGMKNIVMLIVRASVACVFAVLVKILDVFGVFGEKASYSMPIFISLIIIAAAELFVFSRSFTRKPEGRRRMWIWFSAVYAALLAVCGIITQDIFAFELFPNGFGTFEFVLVPIHLILHISAVAIAYFVMEKRNHG